MVLVNCNVKCHDGSLGLEPVIIAISLICWSIILNNRLTTESIKC